MKVPVCTERRIYVRRNSSRIYLRFRELVSGVDLEVSEEKLSSRITVFIQSLQVKGYPESISMFAPDETEDRSSYFAMNFLENPTRIRPLGEATRSKLDRAISMCVLRGVRKRTSFRDSDSGAFRISRCHDEIYSCVRVRIRCTSRLCRDSNGKLVCEFCLKSKLGSLGVRHGYRCQVAITPRSSKLTSSK